MSPRGESHPSDFGEIADIEADPTHGRTYAQASQHSTGNSTKMSRPAIRFDRQLSGQRAMGFVRNEEFTVGQLHSDRD